MKSPLLAAVRSATDLLFPPRCVHCGADGNLFCDRCEVESTRLKTSDTCLSCALPISTERGRNTCEACFVEPPALDRAIAVFTYEPAVRDAVTKFKYKDIRALAPRLGSLMAEALSDSLRGSIDALIPVPITRSRLRSRGYNQSELLASRLSAICDIPMTGTLLARRDSARPQAKSTSIATRIENVRDAFEVTGEVEGGRILLIDDVMTTGSTLNACADALKESGAAWVGALALAREL